MKVTELKNKYEKSAATGSIGYAGCCRVIMDEQCNDYVKCNLPVFEIHEIKKFLKHINTIKYYKL